VTARDGIETADAGDAGNAGKNDGAALSNPWHAAKNGF
jgi:hypothetical protein